MRKSESKNQLKTAMLMCALTSLTPQLAVAGNSVSTAQWKFSGDKHKSLQVDTERTFHLRYPLVML